MEEANLSDADTDELLGLSGIEPFGSGASVYLTPTKSPPGSPSELLASSPKRTPAVKTTSGGSLGSGIAHISPSRRVSGQPSLTRGKNGAKSSKHAVRKFSDSPGKLTLGDLKVKNEGSVNLVNRRSLSQERLVHVRRYLENQGREILNQQNKENLSKSVEVLGGACKNTNSALTSGSKTSLETAIGGKSLPSSPYTSSTYRIENVVVTSHRRVQVPPNGISWSDPDAPVNKVPAKPIDPIFTYKRKLFQEDNKADPKQKLKTTSVVEKNMNKKGQVVTDKSNKKAPLQNRQSPKKGVVHSGSPTQQTHSASKYKVSPRRSKKGSAKSSGKVQRPSRSLDSSPDKNPSSIMKGTGSVSPGRRPGPVTFRKSPSSDKTSPTSTKSVSPPKYESSPQWISDMQKYPYTEQSSVYSKLRNSTQPAKSNVQYSPEKYDNGFHCTPATSGYYSGKSAFNQDGYSNPLDDVLQQYPLSPLRGDKEMSLPDSPGMKAAAETVMTADEYEDMPKEVYADVTSFDIEEMEGARDSLRTMLTLSSKNPELHLNLGGSAHNESISTFRSYPEEVFHDGGIQQDDSFEEVAAKALMGSHNEIDYDQALQITSQLLGRDKEARDIPNSTLEMENSVLVDNLEREKFRRQHCEKQIGNLQSRLLETQEQLAVAVSTEKKKDIMIEQLDKTLSRVVEGWKKREAEKKECIEVLKEEKNEFEQRYLNQKDMLQKFEERLQKASSDLVMEQRRCAELEETKQAKLEQHEEERQQWAEAVDQERSRREQAEDDHDRARDGLEHVQAQLDNLQDTLNRERNEWVDSETRLHKKMGNLEDNYKRDLENEQKQVKEQTELARGTKEQLNSTNLDLQKTRSDLETAMRERDNLKMELSLLEARMESSKRQLEADLTSEFEKALSEKMNEAHDRLVHTETDLREGHRKQIQELNQRHSDDLEEQMSTMTEDFKKKEAYLKEQSKTYEDRLEEAKEEMRELKANKHKMELQREREEFHDRYASGERKIEMANRMQSMMQTHCSEALLLLNNSSSPVTSKSYQHDSVLSHISAMADQNTTTGIREDQRPSNILSEEDDDGAISDVLSTEGESTLPTYTRSLVHPQPMCGAQSTYVPPFSLAHLQQPPINDITSLDSNRSSNFGSASQVTSQYPYSSVSHQPYVPGSVYQLSNAYSSMYEPISQPYTAPYTGSNGPSRNSFASTQPMRNNSTHPAANTFSNPPTCYASQPILNYHNPPMSTGYANPPIGNHQTNQPMKSLFISGDSYISQTNYSALSQPPQVMEDVTKSDYSYLYNGNTNISEPSAPSLSSGYSSMANHSSRFSELTRNGDHHLDSVKDESADTVSLLNGSTATHNDTCDISTRMEQHNQRQQELEHYVRVLLGKEPGVPVEKDEAEMKVMSDHEPTSKHQPDSTKACSNGKQNSRLVSTAHAPKYGSVMGLAREKLHVKKKGQESQAADECKSVVRKSRDGPIGKSTAAKPWR